MTLSEFESKTEWDNVVCLPIIDLSRNYKNENTFDQQSLDFINSEKLINFINQIEFEIANLSNIHMTKKNFLWKIYFFITFWKRADLKKEYLAQYHRIIYLANQPFDNKNRFHNQCLYTLYSKLTGNHANAFKRYGHHWEEIGFQGSDPSTDLRGVGMLGLFQLTFFVISPKTSSICEEIYNLSVDSKQYYPFAITSMNITQISMHALRDGIMNNRINKSGSVWNEFNNCFNSLFYQFHKIWKNEKKNIMDIGYILKDLRSNVKNNFQKMLNEFVADQNNIENVNQQDKFEFTNIVNID